VPPLDALVLAGHDVVLVVTQPDRKRGRGGSLQATPVKAAAARHEIAVTDRVDDVLDARADLGVVVAFGKLIRPHVLAALPMVNLHFSLLPRWRGAAPVERAILAGDAVTGVSLMQLDEGLDTGPVYGTAEVPIDPSVTATDLRSALVAAGTTLLIDRLQRGLGAARAQEGEATYATKIDPAEFELDFTMSSAQVDRVVRLGRAWTTFRGRRLGVITARPIGSGPAPGVLEGCIVGCGDGTGLELITVQPEGKQPQRASDWRNGARPVPGDRLGR